MITSQFLNVYSAGRAIVAAREVVVDQSRPEAAAEKVRLAVWAASREHGLAEVPDYEVFAFREPAEQAAGPRNQVISGAS